MKCCMDIDVALVLLQEESIVRDYPSVVMVRVGRRGAPNGRLSPSVQRVAPVLEHGMVPEFFWEPFGAAAVPHAGAIWVLGSAGPVQHVLGDQLEQFGLGGRVRKLG